MPPLRWKVRTQSSFIHARADICLVHPIGYRYTPSALTRSHAYGSNQHVLIIPDGFIAQL